MLASGLDISSATVAEEDGIHEDSDSRFGGVLCSGLGDQRMGASRPRRRGQANHDLALLYRTYPSSRLGSRRGGCCRRITGCLARAKNAHNFYWRINLPQRECIRCQLLFRVSGTDSDYRLCR